MWTPLRRSASPALRRRWNKFHAQSACPRGTGCRMSSPGWEFRYRCTCAYSFHPHQPTELDRTNILACLLLLSYHPSKISTVRPPLLNTGHQRTMCIEWSWHVLQSGQRRKLHTQIHQLERIPSGTQRTQYPKEISAGEVVVS